MKRNATLVIALLMAACSSSSNGTTTGTAGGNGTNGSGTTGASGGGTTGTGNPVGLWLDGVAALSTSELAASGSPAPSDTCVSSGAVSNAQGTAAFDAHGDLWSTGVSNGDGAIFMWTPAQLAQGCTTVPAAIVTVTDATGFSSLAFDSSGNLWGTEDEEQRLYGYKASDLAASGSISATWSMSEGFGGTTDTLYQPLGLAFDSSGTLWIGNFFSVIAFKAATLASATVAADVSPAGDFFITNPAAQGYEEDAGGVAGYGFFQYGNLAFDSTGDLWVTVQNNTDAGAPAEILEFSKSELENLTANPYPTPSFVISETAEQLDAGFGLFQYSTLAFDSAGNLWAGCSGGLTPNLLRFPAANLATGGSGLFDIGITTSNQSGADSLAFNPIPTGLPIQP